jgi:hypothetical protein
MRLRSGLLVVGAARPPGVAAYVPPIPCPVVPVRPLGPVRWSCMLSLAPGYVVLLVPGALDEAPELTAEPAPVPIWANASVDIARPPAMISARPAVWQRAQVFPWRSHAKGHAPHGPKPEHGGWFPFRLEHRGRRKRLLPTGFQQSRDCQHRAHSAPRGSARRLAGMGITAANDKAVRANGRRLTRRR